MGRCASRNTPELPADMRRSAVGAHIFAGLIIPNMDSSPYLVQRQMVEVLCRLQEYADSIAESAQSSAIFDIECGIVWRYSWFKNDSS